MHVKLRRGTVFWAVLSLALAGPACTKSVRVPVDSYGEPGIGEVGRWRIKVIGDREYIARRFHMTDSALIIDEFDPNSGPGRGVQSLPHPVPLEDVISVDELRESKATLPIVIGVALIATVAIVWVVASIPED
jgi:hypothetical protein